MPTEDEDDDLSAHTNLDPSVAALLEPVKTEEASQSLLRTRIALMKLQQSRIRGNSDYAAKIMDHAIEEGARDRTAWTLLDQHIKRVEKQCAELAEGKVSDKEDEGDKEKDEKEEIDKNDNKEENDDREEENEDSEEVTSEEVKRLKQQISEEKERANVMEELLEQCLQEEIGSVLAEQNSLREREEKLKARIRSLELAIKKVPPKSTKVLEDMMKEAQENQCSLVSAQCSVCHEQSATKAVIPCGHLCLCEECTTSITKLDSTQRTCPLCRGNLLSTLHIYTSK